eukprot:6211908-Pleurochrysis_carterae.AAC.4
MVTGGGDGRGSSSGAAREGGGKRGCAGGGACGDACNGACGGACLRHASSEAVPCGLAGRFARRQECRHVGGRLHVVPPEGDRKFERGQFRAYVSGHRAPLSFAYAVLSGDVQRYRCESHALLEKTVSNLLRRQIAGVVRVHASNRDSV